MLAPLHHCRSPICSIKSYDICTCSYLFTDWCRIVYTYFLYFHALHQKDTPPQSDHEDQDDNDDTESKKSSDHEEDNKSDSDKEESDNDEKEESDNDEKEESDNDNKEDNRSRSSSSASSKKSESSKEEDEEQEKEFILDEIEDNLSYEEKVRKALTGDMDFHYPEKAKIVRIFTSSTFTGKRCVMRRSFRRMSSFSPVPLVLCLPPRQGRNRTGPGCIFRLC